MIMIQKSSTKYQQIHYLISDLSQSCINCVISKRINTQDQWKKNSVSSNRTTHNFDKGSKEIQWINSHFKKQCWNNGHLIKLQTFTSLFFNVPFSIPWSNSEYYITFSCHISYGLWQSFLYFMTLTTLRNTRQILFRMPFNLDFV